MYTCDLSKKNHLDTRCKLALRVIRSTGFSTVTSAKCQCVWSTGTGMMVQKGLGTSRTPCWCLLLFTALALIVSSGLWCEHFFWTPQRMEQVFLRRAGRVGVAGGFHEWRNVRSGRFFCIKMLFYKNDWSMWETFWLCYNFRRLPYENSNVTVVMSTFSCIF